LIDIIENQRPLHRLEQNELEGKVGLCTSPMKAQGGQLNQRHLPVQWRWVALGRT
jgi:hypothetical protein